MQTEAELIKIGTGFLDTYRYTNAIDYFTQAIATNPSNSETFELRGIAWFRIYEIEKALQDTSTAIELDKENHRAWFKKGEMLNYKKEHREAELCYLQANRIYPDSLFYLTGLIETTLALKKYDESINYCNQVLKETPADKIALYYRGLCCAKQLKYDAAIKDFLKLIEIGRRTGAIYNNLGFWYSKIKELKRANNNLSIALQLNPTDPYALNNLGYVKI